jgi:hypothetical protein
VVKSVQMSKKTPPDKTIREVYVLERVRGRRTDWQDKSNENAVLTAIENCDAELLTEILERANVLPGSEGWKKAWRAFYEHCGTP